jgi:hypothetical protein
VPEASKPNVEVLVKHFAPQICEKIQYACKKAKSEMELLDVVSRIDEEAAKLWGLTPTELKAIQKVLKEMARPWRSAEGV